MREHYELELAVRKGPAEAWTALVDRIKRTVSSKDPLDDVELAYALLRAEPALDALYPRQWPARVMVTGQRCPVFFI